MHRAKQRFDDAIARVRNLDTLFNHLTVTLRYSSNDVDDILRSEIVYAVSAFDKLIHEFEYRQKISDAIRTSPVYRYVTPPNYYQEIVSFIYYKSRKFF